MAQAITPATAGSIIGIMPTYPPNEALVADVGVPSPHLIRPLANYPGVPKFARCSCGITAPDAATLAAATHAPGTPCRGQTASDGSHLWAWQLCEPAPPFGTVHSIGRFAGQGPNPYGPVLRPFIFAM